MQVSLPRVAEAAPKDQAASGLGAPFMAVCVLTFVVFGRPQDYLPFLLPLRLALVSTAIATVLTVFSRGPSLSELFAARETRLYFVFYAVMVIGIPFAVHRPGAFEMVVLEYPVNLAYYLMLLYHVDSVAKLKRLGIVLVLSGFVFTVLGLRMGEFADGRYFIPTGMFDPNDIAYVVLSLIAFAVWILVGSFGFVPKALALVTVLGGMLLTLYTASRGGLLGLVMFFVLFMSMGVKRVTKLTKALLLVGIVVAAIANKEKINIDRYMTLTSIEDDYNFEEGGRADLWGRGWRLFLQHPLTGVGAYGFAPAIGWMRQAEKASTLKWQTAHSSYILVLTETGLFGALAFLLLILRCLGTFNHLRRRSAQLQDPDLAALPGLLLIGFGAQLVAAVFLSQTYSMFFTLAFALSAILHRVAPAAATADGATAVIEPVRTWTPPASRPVRPTAWNSR